MTLGAYLALSAVTLTGFTPFAALAPAAVVTALTALAIHCWFYRPLANLPTIALVIASFGVALMVRSLVQLLWGVEIQSYRTGIEKPLILFDTLRIAERHILIMLVTLALVLALHVFLTYTRMGKAMRAVADDPELALVAGIDTAAVIRWVWLIGAVLAAAAGVFLGIDGELNPNMGWDLLLPLFAATILGGIGRPFGAIAGGLVIGLAEELSTYPWLSEEPLVSPGYKSAIAFAVMVALLIWRPQGLARGSVF
jgi:branched-subunit amino acid ABC-type transport system permease component